MLSEIATCEPRLASYFVTTNFKLGSVESRILVRRSLDPPKLAFVRGNRVVDVKWQFDCHESYQR